MWATGSGARGLGFGKIQGIRSGTFPAGFPDLVPRSWILVRPGRVHGSRGLDRVQPIWDQRGVSPRSAAPDLARTANPMIRCSRSGRHAWTIPDPPHRIFHPENRLHGPQDPPRPRPLGAAAVAGRDRLAGHQPPSAGRARHTRLVAGRPDVTVGTRPHGGREPAGSRRQSLAEARARRAAVAQPSSAIAQPRPAASHGRSAPRPAPASARPQPTAPHRGHHGPQPHTTSIATHRLTPRASRPASAIARPQPTASHREHHGPQPHTTSIATHRLTPRASRPASAIARPQPTASHRKHRGRQPRTAGVATGLG